MADFTIGKNTVKTHTTASGYTEIVTASGSSATGTGSLHTVYLRVSTGGVSGKIGTFEKSGNYANDRDYISTSIPVGNPTEITGLSIQCVLGDYLGQYARGVDANSSTARLYKNQDLFGQGSVLCLAQAGYAPCIWGVGSPTSFDVTYDGNGNTGGSVPTDPSSPYEEGETVTVLGNTGGLEKTGYRFSCWNTQADGLGTDYDPSDTFLMGTSAVTLYAKWVAAYTVTYNGNGNGGGSVPTDPSSPYDSGSTVTVLGNTGNLTKEGYIFLGWKINGIGNTYLSGNSFVISENTVFYAQWGGRKRVKKYMGISMFHRG